MRITEDLEALKLALKSEEDGHKFYKQAEGRVSSPLLEG
jgi:rubrerythrin